MPRFDYIALDARGQESRGTLDGSNPNDVVGQLRQAGYFPTSVLEEGKGGAAVVKKTQKAAKIASAPKAKSAGFMARKTIKSKTLMIFTRQLATLIDAGLPLLRGLNVLAKQEKDAVLKNTINALADSVQGGSTFSESMAQHPRLFNKLYVNMVKAGELGGVLELVLNRLAEFQEKAQKIKNKVVSAMAYPIIVLIIAIVILLFLLAFIVPKFQQIFNDMLAGKPLPALTVGVIGASDAVKKFFTWPWGGVLPGMGENSTAGQDLVATFTTLNIFMTAFTIFAIVYIYKYISNTPGGRVNIDKMKLKMPLFGDLTRKSAISRFSRTLGTLVTSGVPILQALNITRDTAGNAIIADAITKVHDAVKEGESIVAPLEASGVFPPMVISMVDVGEETGQLPEMLLKIAEVYDDEVDNAVEGLTSLLEPLMIVFLALVVGTIVIALFMPLIEVIKGMQNPGA